MTVLAHPELSSDVLRQSAAALQDTLSGDDAPLQVSLVARTDEAVLAARPEV